MKPPIRFSVVVLPQPEGPSRQKNSPSAISRSVGFSARLRAVALGDAAERDRRRLARSCRLAAAGAARTRAGRGRSRCRGSPPSRIASTSSAAACRPTSARVVGDRRQRRLEQRAEVRIVEARERELVRERAARAPGRRRGSRARARRSRRRPRSASARAPAARASLAARPPASTGSTRTSSARTGSPWRSHRGVEGIEPLVPARLVERAGEKRDPAVAVLDEMVDEQARSPRRCRASTEPAPAPASMLSKKTHGVPRRRRSRRSAPGEMPTVASSSPSTWWLSSVRSAATSPASSCPESISITR